MGVFRQFPYSNFHEMNMDEIIKIIKNMLEEWATYHAEWDQWMSDLKASWTEYQDDVNAQWAAYQNTMNTAWQSMQNFINNYFDNLDVQDEINNKIVSMIQTGEFGLLVNEYIPPAVNAWLNLNITEPTGVVIDTSLSVSGACADAKATGDAINDLLRDINAVDINFKNLITSQFLEASATNYFPQITAFAATGYYLMNGTTHADEDYSYTDYIPIEGNTAYAICLVPAYGETPYPWFNCTNGLEFYDENHTFVANARPSNGLFTSPISAKYIRVNVATGAGVALDVMNARCMLTKGTTLPTTYAPVSVDTYYNYPQIIEDINSELYYTSDNKYNPSIQTPETISPHYYVDGEPYSSTQFDTFWNCTALIPVKPNTQYTIGLVPAYGVYVKPWGTASYGVFQYDENGDYNNSETSDNTFTTLSTTKYIRFNYNIGNGISLNILNSSCVLVEGDTLPEEYIIYEDGSVKDKIDSIENAINGIIDRPKIQYIIDQNGTGVTLIAKYNENYDIAFNIKKKGGNNLFDFDSIGIIPNTEKRVSTSTDGIQYIISSSGDWFAPFMVKAVNNSDGDNPSSYYFTGGNHQYNNQGSGSTPTARTTILKFLADNMEVTTGSDGCLRFEMIWTNLVQGYNTTKADGSGREILQENHRLIFDGIKFEAFVDLIPLEEVLMMTWYGFQWFTSPYPKVRFIGATNREEYTVAAADANCGDTKCCYAVGYGNDHEIRINVDDSYDLGDHKYFLTGSSLFTSSYGKGYFNIIKNTTLYEGDMYSLHGYYQFMPHN